MPQRMKIMHDDGLQLPIATSSAVVLYGWTLDTIILFLWAAYVVMLILIKLPDLFSKYPILGRMAKVAYRNTLGRFHGNRD